MNVPLRHTLNFLKNRIYRDKHKIRNKYLSNMQISFRNTYFGRNFEALHIYFFVH